MKNIPFVLLMDDDDAVRYVAASVIDRLGYEVATANKGEHAIELLKSRQSEGLPVDAVMLDLSIENGLGGLETLTAMRDLNADFKAILVSGYSPDWIEENHPGHGFDKLISKPFSMGDLKACLSEMIGEPTGD